MELMPIGSFVVYERELDVTKEYSTEKVIVNEEEVLLLEQYVKNTQIIPLGVYGERKMAKIAIAHIFNIPVLSLPDIYPRLGAEAQWDILLLGLLRDASGDIGDQAISPQFYIPQPTQAPFRPLAHNSSRTLSKDGQGLPK